MVKQCVVSERKRKLVRGKMLKREGVLRAQVRSVVQGYTSAMFIHGPGGLGKSHIVATELESLVGKGYRHHTAYTTPKALMLALAEYPEQVHVFEDCEKLYKTDVSCSILRAACGSARQRERWVTYETAHENLKVNFKGGIIVVSNENLARGSGPLSGVASRFRPVLWDLTVDERMVRILDMADDGWTRGDRRLTPGECREVADYLVEEMVSGELTVPVDLRTFAEHALPAFAQSKAGRSGEMWKEIIRSKLQGLVPTVEKRGEKSSRLQLLAFSLAANKELDGKAKVAKWVEVTGLGRAIFYRHVRAARTTR